MRWTTSRKLVQKLATAEQVVNDRYSNLISMSAGTPPESAAHNVASWSIAIEGFLRHVCYTFHCRPPENNAKG
jgi:hypothetical protein